MLQEAWSTELQAVCWAGCYWKLLKRKACCMSDKAFITPPSTLPPLAFSPGSQKPSLPYLLRLRSPLYSLTESAKGPKWTFTASLQNVSSLQRAGVEGDHCQKPWRYFSAVYHQWSFWAHSGRWQHSLLCSSSSPGGTCSPSCLYLSCPLLGEGSLGNWTAIVIVNQLYEYANFRFLEWKPLMKLSAVSSYSGLLYSYCLVKACLECDVHQHCSVTKCLFESKKGAPRGTATTTKRDTGIKKTASRSRLSVLELEES